MVHAYNKGELNKSDVGADLYAKVKKIANNMTDSDAKKLAKTKHDGLPEKVPTAEFASKVPDAIRHFNILLNEHNLNTLNATINKDKSATLIVSGSNGQPYDILFSDKIYLISEQYNFEIGQYDDIDISVKSFKRLTQFSEDELKKEYNTCVLD